MAGKVLLIRHGDTGIEYRGRYIGSTDVSLSPMGRRQALLLTGPLSDVKAGKYLCSPLRRARETFQAALNGSGGSPELDSGLREVDFGAWEGKTFAEIESDDPEAVSAWAAQQPDFAFPGGEGIAAFRQRVAAVGKKIAATPYETVAVFTHGGVIRALICHYLALDISHHLYFEIKPASLTTLLLHNGRGVLAGLNDRCHLGELRNG